MGASVSSIDIPAQITPDDESAFTGFPWGTTILLPSHETNEDGTQGAPIDWSGSTFTVLSSQIDPDLFTVTFDGQNTVQLSLEAASVTTSFRWYLAESPVYGVPLLWRRVKLDAAR